MLFEVVLRLGCNSNDEGLVAIRLLSDSLAYINTRQRIIQVYVEQVKLVAAPFPVC